MERWKKSSGFVSSAKFLIVRTDKTALRLHAFHEDWHRKSYYLEHLEINSDAYNWWVNWTP